MILIPQIYSDEKGYSNQLCLFSYSCKIYSDIGYSIHLIHSLSITFIFQVLKFKLFLKPNLVFFYHIKPKLVFHKPTGITGGGNNLSFFLFFALKFKLPVPVLRQVFQRIFHCKTHFRWLVVQNCYSGFAGNEYQR